MEELLLLRSKERTVVSIFQFVANIGWTNGGNVNYPGQAKSLLSLASYSSTFSKGCGLAQCWYPDNSTYAAVNNGGFNTQQGYLIQLPNPKGSFQCAIPMQHIRFCG